MRFSVVAMLACALAACDGTIVTGADGGSHPDDDGGVSPDPGDNRPPVVVDPGPQTVDEDTTLRLTLDVSDPDGDLVRLFALGLPPGAFLDETTRTIVFTPDFTQGGGRDDSTIELIARDARGATTTVRVPIAIRDTIQLPAPAITKTERGSTASALTLSIPPHPYLDPTRAANLPDGTTLEDGRAIGVWDRLDLTRVLDASAEARDQHLFLKHGKDDTTIHFGAVVLPIPLSGLPAYAAFSVNHAGLYAVWDEGGHGDLDPVLGAGWWDRGWSRATDPHAFLRRDRAFPAFTRSRADGDPGDGSGNGKRPFTASSGYAGNVEVAGDTGWSGDVAGAINRFLRWDGNGVVDTVERLEIPLFVAESSGAAAPRVGYPTKGDRYDGPLPLLVDVTPRRVRAFRCRPGEVVRWRFGDAAGTATADVRGDVTVADVPLTRTPTPLVLERDGW
jgi:hypothetical protein